MNKTKSAIILLALVLAWCSLVQAQSTIVLLEEDFESLSLGPNVDEGVAGDAVWTDIPSPGWINDANGVPGVDDPATDGVTEWAGWGFADKDWWVETAGDQDRSQFDLGQGIVAVADPDEWDDASHPGPMSEDAYDVWLSTPPIDLSVSKAGTVQLQFDSSWVPEFDDNYHQSARVSVSFDGEEPIELLLWVSESGNANYKESATNETVTLDIDNPANASSMVLTFGLFDAGNDWWWAIDNIVVKAAQRADRAYNPSPQNESDELAAKTVLSWSPGEYVGGLSPQHKVILSDNLDAVADGSAVVSTQDANSLDAAGLLEYSTTYYWRVDEANQTSGWDEGSIWKFTTEPYSIQIAGSDIIATASSFSNEFSTAEKTVDGSGLSEDNTHAIQTEAMWFTAMGDMDPWIQYEFDDVKKLDTMTVWNSNSSAEGFIGYGIKGVSIEYSKDGQTWETLEDANELSQAPGLPTYAQYDEIPFDGLAAKMVRLTIQSNWGGFMQAYSLSEVQFHVIPAAARTPEPVSGSVDILPNAVLSWRAGREAVQSTIYIGTDSNEVAAGLANSAMSNTNSIDLTLLDLEMGETYYWRVDEVNNAEVESVWAGPVWSFSTVDALVVDDFESYTNDSPNRPFQTWDDGFGYSADEFFPVAYGGNGTGSGVGHDIWSGGSAHYNGDIMEGMIAKSGQSMPLYYNNTGGSGMSETKRTFDRSQDWTAHGIQSLSLSFRGEVGNSGQLYIKINETKVVYSGIPNAIEKTAWLSMIVDLSSVSTNLNAVTSLTIGVEGAGAQGVVYIDDIKLYALPLTMIEPVAPTEGDSDLIGLWKLNDGNGTTATDSSGNNRHGVLTNGPLWITDGALGGALQCDGVDDYVVLDTISYGDGSGSDFSVALWVRTSGWDDDSAIISNKDWNSGSNVGWAIAGGGGNNGSWQWNYSDGSTRVDFDPSVAVSPISGGEWCHLCVTHDRDGLAKFYYEGQFIGEVDISGVTGSLDPGLPTVLGTDGSEAAVWAYWFSGAFDDVRIYNRILSEGEILGLNGVTAPVPQAF